MKAKSLQVFPIHKNYLFCKVSVYSHKGRILVLSGVFWFVFFFFWGKKLLILIFLSIYSWTLCLSPVRPSSNSSDSFVIKMEDKWHSIHPDSVGTHPDPFRLLIWWSGLQILCDSLLPQWSFLHTSLTCPHNSLYSKVSWDNKWILTQLTVRTKIWDFLWVNCDWQLQILLQKKVGIIVFAHAPPVYNVVGTWVIGRQSVLRMFTLRASSSTMLTVFWSLPGWPIDPGQLLYDSRQEKLSLLKFKLSLDSKPTLLKWKF